MISTYKNLGYVMLFVGMQLLFSNNILGIEPLEKVKFSHESGFYPDEFNVVLSHNRNDVVIRYTTDGSAPGPDSDIFPNSLRVYDRSSEALTISLIPTSTAWKTPGALKKQAMVINARAFREGFEPSPVSSAVYFVNNHGSFSHHLPVLSLIADPAAFFDDETGIYVSGTGSIANFHQRGEEWEREVQFDFFEDDGSLVFSDGAGVRIHGGTSRNFPHKSLRLYFRNAYGDNWLEHDVFPGNEVKRFKRLILRNTGHDDRPALIWDGFMQGLLSNTIMDLQGYRACIVYINGEYWGLHKIRERYDKHYLSSHHNVDPDNIDLLTYTGYSVAEGDAEHYIAMLEFLENNSLEDDNVFQHLNTLMDIDSYMDYKISEIFFYRWDIGNIRHWRERTPEGRWRWMMFDLDTGYGGFWATEQPWEFNMLEYNTEADGAWTHLTGHNHNRPQATFLLRKLLENQSYRKKFVSRFADLLNSNFLSDEAIKLIDEYAGLIAHEVPYHVSRWQRLPSEDFWYEELEKMKDFAIYRPDVQRSQLMDFFGIEGTVNLTVDVEDIATGYVRVNTLDIEPSTPGVSSVPYPWEGIYFKGHEIKMEAVASPGYMFSHWEGIVDSEDSQIVLNADDDIFIKAHFKLSTEPVLIHYWLFDVNVPNDTPLEKIGPVYTLLSGANLNFESCLAGYPYHTGHLLWRKASMERRNLPTSLNYRPEGNESKSYQESNMRGLQVKQPFRSGERQNSMIFSIPSLGFTDLVFRFAAQDENAVREIVVDYSADNGETWSFDGLDNNILPLFQNYQHIYEIDFGEVQVANDNSDFKIRLRFDGEDLTFDYGNRVTFNNFSLEGIPLKRHIISSQSGEHGKLDPEGVFTIYDGGDMDFMIYPETGFQITKLSVNDESVIDELRYNNDGVAYYSLKDISSDYLIFAEFSPDTGKEETEQKTVIFPNPARDLLNVMAVDSITKVEIVNLTGQKLISRGGYGAFSVKVNLRDLNAGVYVVVIYTAKDIITRKLLISK